MFVCCLLLGIFSFLYSHILIAEIVVMVEFFFFGEFDLEFWWEGPTFAKIGKRLLQQNLLL